MQLTSVPPAAPVRPAAHDPPSGSVAKRKTKLAEVARIVLPPKREETGPLPAAPSAAPEPSATVVPPSFPVPVPAPAARTVLRPPTRHIPAQVIAEVPGDSPFLARTAPPKPAAGPVPAEPPATPTPAPIRAETLAAPAIAKAPRQDARAAAGGPAGRRGKSRRRFRCPRCRGAAEAHPLHALRPARRGGADRHPAPHQLRGAAV
ncbi:MAG: hypothetical protein WDO13_13840 [Verrucomicrobiota bacterium]